MKCLISCVISMTYELEASNEFEVDVDESVAYISNELKSPRAALSLLEELRDAFDCLKEDPFLAAISRKPVLRSHECREYLVKNYVIVYKVRANTVSLMGFYHQRQLYDLRFLDRKAYQERVVRDELLESMGLPLPKVSRFSFMADDEIKLEEAISQGHISIEELWKGEWGKGAGSVDDCCS